MRTMTTRALCLLTSRGRVFVAIGVLVVAAAGQVRAEPVGRRGVGAFPEELRRALESKQFVAGLQWLRGRQQATADEQAAWFEGIAEAAQTAGRSADVAGLLAKWRRESPDDLQVLLCMGDWLLLTGKEGEAVQAYRQAIRLAPESPVPFWRLGRVHLEGGDYGLARAEFELAQRRDGTFWPAEREFARGLAACGQFDRAETLIRARLRTDSGAAVSALLGERLMMTAGKEHEAWETFQQALKQQPDNADALYGVAALTERAFWGDLGSRNAFENMNSSPREQWQAFLAVEPYGRRAAAVRAGRAVIELQRLRGFPESVQCPTYSPEGRFMAFTTGKDEALWIRSVGSGSVARKLTEPGQQDQGPVWSPLGDRLAFVRRAKADSGIYLVSPLGSDPPKRLVPPPERGHNVALSWSPDGAALVFNRSGAGLCRVDVASGKWKGYGTLGTDKLLFDAHFIGEADTLVVCQRLSPERGELTLDTLAELAYVEDAFQPEPKVRLLTRLGACCRAPVPSPDGGRVALVCNAHDRRRADLWLLTHRTDDPPVCLVPTAPGGSPTARRPAWSPDGRSLTFARDGHLWRVTLGGLPDIPVEVRLDARGDQARVALRSFADQALALTLYWQWYDERSQLVADNWDTPGKPVDLPAGATREVECALPSKGHPVTLKVQLFDPEGRSVIRLLTLDPGAGTGADSSH